ncbi:hypothetical protein BpHYR1_016484 [Brachionus plicatilis]|uniref:Uncharacterized protein n=1 Tax=Brachionus plicatilis TaxID=10195 RepID=A0A3M7T4U1_BRAPC|nr:hypothetical protein BpHYR1_016484 [Brachionus plicatilis]
MAIFSVAYGLNFLDFVEFNYTVLYNVGWRKDRSYSNGLFRKKKGDLSVTCISVYKTGPRRTVRIVLKHRPSRLSRSSDLAKTGRSYRRTTGQQHHVPPTLRPTQTPFNLIKITETWGFFQNQI